MARLISFCLFLSSLLIVSFASPAMADKRVALVVGNGTYLNFPRLDNPANDARLLADTLRDLGFALIGGDAQLDLDKASFDRAVQDFGAQLQGADVGLFYYAGHGVQVRDANYLIPVDANPTREADVDFQMLDANLVLRQMESAGTRLNLVILDACRNNPFGGRGLVSGRGRNTETVRDISRGLARMQAPEGTLISFATQPGSVAQDGADGHSPFSKALAEVIRRPGLGLFDVFNQIGLEVKRATGGAQQPWVSSSPIDGAFYFVPGLGAAVQQAVLPPRPPQPSASTAAPTPSGASRFDGVWTVRWVCEDASSVLPRVEGRMAVTMSNGIVRGERGTAGAPASVAFEGAVEPNGITLITASGLTGDSKTDPYHRPLGTKFSFTVLGALEGGAGTGTRGDRDCDVKFTRQSVGAGATAAATEPDGRPSEAAGTLSPPAASDEAAWNFVRGMKSREAVQAFIRQFPASAHRPEAEILIAALAPPAPILTERPKADRSARIPPGEPRAHPGAGWSCSALYRGCEANCAAGGGPGCIARRCVPKRTECLASGCWRGLRFNGCGVTKS